MNRISEKSANTDLYARIQGTPMSDSEREVALSAIRNAEWIVDAILRATNGAKTLIAKVFEKPADFRHSH